MNSVKANDLNTFKSKEEQVISRVNCCPFDNEQTDCCEEGLCLRHSLPEVFELFNTLLIIYSSYHRPETSTTSSRTIIIQHIFKISSAKQFKPLLSL